MSGGGHSREIMRRSRVWIRVFHTKPIVVVWHQSRKKGKIAVSQVKVPSPLARICSTVHIEPNTLGSSSVAMVDQLQWLGSTVDRLLSTPNCNTCRSTARKNPKVSPPSLASSSQGPLPPQGPARADHPRSSWSTPSAAA